MAMARAGIAFRVPRLLELLPALALALALALAAPAGGAPVTFLRPADPCATHPAGAALEVAVLAPDAGCVHLEVWAGGEGEQHPWDYDVPPVNRATTRLSACAGDPAAPGGAAGAVRSFTLPPPAPGFVQLVAYASASASFPAPASASASVALCVGDSPPRAADVARARAHASSRRRERAAREYAGGAAAGYEPSGALAAPEAACPAPEAACPAPALGWMLDAGVAEALAGAGAHGDAAGALARAFRPVPGAANVWEGRLLSEAGRGALLEELAGAEAQAAAGTVVLSRPNSMNRHGFVLRELGLGWLLHAMLEEVGRPLGLALLPQHAHGIGEVHGFTVVYEAGADTSLGVHMDDSTITLNICLSASASGAALRFSGERDHPTELTENVTLAHMPGHAVVHVGQHFHSVGDLTGGRRENLVLWMRAPERYESNAEAYGLQCGEG